MPTLLFLTFNGVLTLNPPSFLNGSPVCLSIRKDFLLDSVDCTFKHVPAQLTFPNDYHGPALCLQLSPDIFIPFLIPCNFVDPKLSVSLGNNISWTPLMSVPKTAVDENGGPILWQDNVGASGKSLVVNPVPIPSPPQLAPQLQLWLGGSCVYA